MNWYSGGIAEAVAHSKAKDAIFVVYIEGQDEMSTHLTKLIDNERVSELLESDDFVAIKIEGDSQSYVQFMAIYKVVPVPSIFFIGRSGTPLDIGTGVIANANELVKKIEAVLVTAGRPRNCSASDARHLADVGTSAQAAAAAAMKETEVEKTKAPINTMQLNQTSSVRNSAGDDSQQDEEEEKSEHNDDASGPSAKRKKDEKTEEERQTTGLTGPSTVAAARALAATAPAVSPPTVEAAFLQNVTLSESEERLAKVQQMIEQKRAEQHQEELLKQQRQEELLKQQRQEELLKQQQQQRQKENEELQKQQQRQKENEELEKKQQLKQRKENESQQNQEKEKSKDEAEKQHQLELKKLQEMLRRDRLAAEEERDRIRAQIAGDRAERVQASRAFEPGPSTSTASGSMPVLGESLSLGTSMHETRLQLRLPSGIQRTRTFAITDTLSAVREYVHNELLTEATVNDFRLATTYPRREFSFEDDVKTLTELNLVPNAVLLVLNDEQANRIVRSRGLLNMLTAVLWAMITPAAKAFDYVSQMGFSSFTARISERLTALGWKRPDADYVLIQTEMRERRARDSFVAPSYNAQQSSDADATRTPAAVTVSNAGAEVKPEANKRNYSGEATIHRLRDTTKNDDEDKSTYNGNSTQQQ